MAIATGAALGVLIWLVLRALGVWSIVAFDEALSMIAATVCGAILWHWRAGRVIVWASLFVTAVLAVVVMTTSLTSALMTPLIRKDPVPVGESDAVVVLSGGVSDEGLLNYQGLDRFLTGLRFIREGRAPTLVLTRPQYAMRRGHSPDKDWRDLLALLPAMPRVVVVDSVHNTRDEAMGVALLARERGWRRVLLVTSPAHTRRACATFERVGVTTTCVPSESRDAALLALDSMRDRLTAFSLWLYETIGWRVYQSRGWV